MLSVRIILLSIAIFFAGGAMAQFGCYTREQTPGGAIVVCGNNTLTHASPYACSTHQLSVPTCDKYFDLSPIWYKITCYTAGTLGFVITPVDLEDDYDWQLYDITGHRENEVYTTDGSLVVAANWSGTHGLTGASAAGGNRYQCFSDPTLNRPAFCSMPVLATDHVYLLLVSHAVGYGGYSLSFGGGTANITDPVEPHLVSAEPLCGGQTTVIKLSKKADCSSLAPDGSDFMITPPLATIFAANGPSCYSGFETDSISLTLSNPLPAGNYTISIKAGTDGNTITNFCGIGIPEGESVPLSVGPFVPVAMDSITASACGPDEIQLVFRKDILCSTVAWDGSDFIITGSGPVNIVSAAGICKFENLTLLAQVIVIKFSAPLATAGTYQVKLVKGSDGNTVLDNCGLEVLEGSTLNFSTREAVSADFTYNIHYNCKADTIDYFHDGKGSVNSWTWEFFDQQKSSKLQNPSVVYNTFGQKHTKLTVSNGSCTDTRDIPIMLGNGIHADFEATAMLCPNDLAVFKDNSTGNIISWDWNFGNGIISNQPSPSPQTYMVPAARINVYPTLTVKNNYGCIDTASQKIMLYNSCYIAVPNAFTPNRDGLNDYLYPLNGDMATGLLFKVFNRYGQLVFETDNFDKRWDGRFKGQPADPGIYIWILHYTDSATHKYYEKKGTTILLK